MKTLKIISKKALFIVTTIVLTIASKGSDYEPFFKSNYHWTSTTKLANDLETGRVKFSSKVTELQFINLQIQNWNLRMKEFGVVDTANKQYQLPVFSNTGDARSFFVKLLYNNSLDDKSAWEKGYYKIGRVEKNTGHFLTDWERPSYPGEVVASLNPNTLPGVNKSDGDYPDIPGFSLWCGNNLVVKKDPVKEKPVTPPAPPVADNKNNNQSLVENSSYHNNGGATHNYEINVDNHNDAVAKEMRKARKDELDAMVRIEEIRAKNQMISMYVLGGVQTLSSLLGFTNNYLNRKAFQNILSQPRNLSNPFMGYNSQGFVQQQWHSLPFGFQNFNTPFSNPYSTGPIEGSANFLSPVRVIEGSAFGGSNTSYLYNFGAQGRAGY